MTTGEDLGAVAKDIVDSNSYMTLGTADETGRPWASPVWFAPAEYREFFWVSRPGARHSRNLAARVQVGIVIFDSTVPINTGRAVYLEAEARQLSDEAEIDQGLAAFNRRLVAAGEDEWTGADVREPAPLRLYCATVSQLYALNENDERVEIGFEELSGAR